MSGIAAVGSSSFDYYQWLLQLQQSSSTQATKASAAENQSLRTKLTARSGDSADFANVGSEPSSSIEEEIKKAIEEAVLEYLKANGASTAGASQEKSNSVDPANPGSGGVKDLLSVIQDAVEKVLKDNGIDLSQGGPSDVQGMPPPPPPPGMGGMMPPDGPDAGARSNRTGDSMDQLIEFLQQMVTKLQDGESGENSATGLLVDQTA